MTRNTSTAAAARRTVISTLAARASHYSLQAALPSLESLSPCCARGLLFAATAAFLCGFMSASGPAVAAAGAAQAAPPAAQTTEEIIIRAPEVVRRPLPRTPGVAPGLLNPEIVSLTRTVSYADLDLSKAADVAELESRVKNTAKDVCQELNRRYPKNGSQYVYGSADCVKKATDEGLDTVKAIAAAGK